MPHGICVEDCALRTVSEFTDQVETLVATEIRVVNNVPTGRSEVKLSEFFQMFHGLFVVDRKNPLPIEERMIRPSSGLRSRSEGGFSPLVPA